MTLHPIDYDNGQIFCTEPTKDITEGYWHHPKGAVFPVTDAYIKGPISSGIMRKVMAQSPNLSIVNIPYIELEEDIESIVMAMYDDFKLLPMEGMVKPQGSLLRFIVSVYKKASAKRYTEEDLIDLLTKYYEDDAPISYVKRDLPRLFQLLKSNYQALQPKVVSVEVKTVYIPGKQCTCSKQDHFDPCQEGCEESSGKYEPVTYTKDGKTFLKIKKVNYE